MSKNKFELQRWVIPVIGGVVLISIIGGLIYFYQAKNKTVHPGSQVQAVSDSGKNTVAGGAGTDKYNKELRNFEKAESLKAAKSGHTRINIPVGKPDPIKKEDVTIAVDAPKSTPKVTASKAPKAVNRDALRQKAEMQKAINGAIQSELTMINTTMDKASPELTVFVYEAAKSSVEEITNSNSDNSANDSATQRDVVFTPFEVGDVMYAVNTIAINSDVPGPAMIELVTGHLKGGKFIGAFARHNKHLLLKFTAFAFQGKTYPIEALAVDPATSSVAMRSDVDSHYFERWGGLVAASFLEGFAEAVSTSGLSTESTDIGVIVDQPDYSTSDQLWIAAGKVGENLAEPMLENFYRPPTVYLEPGTEIGILIVKN